MSSSIVDTCLITTASGDLSPVFPHRGASLGVNADNGVQFARRIAAGLPYNALVRFRRASGMTIESIAEVVEIPPRTLARRKAAGRFTKPESERLLRLSLLFEKAVQLFEGDVAAARQWLESPKKAFAGQTPLELAQTELGAREVEDLTGRLEHGVFS